MHRSTATASAYKQVFRASGQNSKKIIQSVHYKRTKANWPDVHLNGTEKPDWRMSLPGNVGIIDDQQKDSPKKFNIDEFLTSSKDMQLATQISETNLYNVENTTLPDRTEAAIADCVTKTEISPKPMDFRFFDAKQDAGLVVEFVANANTSASAQECPKLLKDKLSSVMFGSTQSRFKDNISTVLTLNFKTELSQSVYTENMVSERKEIIQKFTKLAKYICFSMINDDRYADFINPSTGKAWINEAHVDQSLSPAEECLGELESLTITDIGCCKIMSHKDFETNVFTGIIVTNAKPDHWFLQKLVTEN